MSADLWREVFQWAFLILIFFGTWADDAAQDKKIRQLEDRLNKLERK